MILHLGVVDIPYSKPPASRRRNGKVASGTQTTGDVAGWLENDYHVMEQFFELHGEQVANDLAEGVKGTIESLIMGSSFAQKPFASAMPKIEDRFRDMLDARELEGVGYPGIPTQAAQRGVNHRLKRPYQRRAPRPSFIDTGLYQASFKAWVD